jgi:hypothetical protein
MAHAAVMSDTKWEEIRLAMYGLGRLSPAWRTRDVRTGYVSAWDGEWFYHFSEGGYDSIEWLEVRVVSQEQSTAVLEALTTIHVPGERIEGGFRIYGYVPTGKFVEYLNAV